jgi:hypothetical protein
VDDYLRTALAALRLAAVAAGGFLCAFAVTPIQDFAFHPHDSVGADLDPLWEQALLFESVDMHFGVRNYLLNLRQAEAAIALCIHIPVLHRYRK